MDVKLATLIKSLNIMDVIFSGFTVCVNSVQRVNPFATGPTKT